MNVDELVIEIKKYLTDADIDAMCWLINRYNRKHLEDMGKTADTNAKRKFIEIALAVQKITNALMCELLPKELDDAPSSTKTDGSR